MTDTEMAAARQEAIREMRAATRAANMKETEARRRLLEGPALLIDTPRGEALREADRIIHADRQDKYGTPENSFARIGLLWTAYRGEWFAPADVAAMMALLKIGRLAETLDHEDSWVDLIGYGATGFEVVAEANDFLQTLLDKLPEGHTK